MLFSRICLLSMGALLPLVLSFRTFADPLAPKQALWGIAGGLLLAFPALPRFRAEPALFIFLGLAAAMSLATGSLPGSLLPWIVGAIIFLRAREAGPGFAAKYARLAAFIASLIALYALSQTVWNSLNTGIRLINPFGERVPGTLGNPTFLADYLAAFLPVSLALMSLSRRSTPFYGWGLASLLLFTAVFLGGSKGGQLSAVAGIAGWAMVFFRVIPRERKLAVIPAAAAILLLGMISATPHRLVNSLSRWTSPSDRFSFTQRLDILYGTGRLVARSPLVGNGPGSFPVIFPSEAPASLSRSLGLTLSVNHAHNDYAEVASDLGLAGLVLLLFILFRGVPASFRPDLRGGFAISTVALAVTMGTNFAVFLPSSAFFIWMHAGLASSRPAIPGAHSSPLPRTLAVLLAFAAGFISVQGLLANSYMRPGQEALEAGSAGRAEEFLSKAAVISPVNRHIFQLLGRAREVGGDLAGADRAYSTARALAPYHPITSFNVARVQREIFLRSGGKDRPALHKSVSALLSAVHSNPYFAEARTWGGELSLASGDRITARQFLLEIPADMSPLSPGLHRQRARFLALEGRKAEASREISSAVVLENRLLLSQSEALIREGRNAEAEIMARKAVKSDPQSGPGWEQLGFILHSRGDLAGARECYRRLEKIDPGSLAAQLNLILLSLSADDKAEARRHLARAEAIAPGKEEVLLAGARVLAFEGKKTEAESAYRALIRLFPRNTQATAELRVLSSR